MRNSSAMRNDASGRRGLTVFGPIDNAAGTLLDGLAREATS